jgi:hypothetical protein
MSKTPIADILVASSLGLFSGAAENPPKEEDRPLRIENIEGAKSANRATHPAAAYKETPATTSWEVVELSKRALAEEARRRKLGLIP